MIPAPTYVGCVVGENCDPRLDEGDFDADDPSTWGRPAAPLLIDRLRQGSTHSVDFAGSGGLKTLSTVIPNLLTFRGNIVCTDPKENLAGRVKDAREAMGKTVRVLDPGKPGINAISWINPASAMFGIDIDGVIEAVCGHTSERDQKSAFFKNRGKKIVKAILADIVEDPQLLPALRTLAEVRRRVAWPSNALALELEFISQNSASVIARDLAGSLAGDLGNSPEMFSGFHSTAAEDTAWLGDPAYASMVSGDAFDVQDIVRGNMDVFIALPLKSLLANAAPARCILGGLMSAVYEAKGKIPGGRVLFIIEEAKRYGRMHIMEVARDTGREFGITMNLIFQSPGQMEDVWGRDGKQAWYDSLSRRSYSGIKSPATAAEVTESLGGYGIVNLSESQNVGSSRSRPFQWKSRSWGSNITHSWARRKLMIEDEIMYDLRPDAQIVIPWQGRPTLIRRAFAPRRPEMRKLVKGMY